MLCFQGTANFLWQTSFSQMKMFRCGRAGLILRCYVCTQDHREVRQSGGHCSVKLASMSKECGSPTAMAMVSLRQRYHEGRKDRLTYCTGYDYMPSSVFNSRLLGLLLKARFICLKCSYLLQDPLLLLLALKSWIRTTTIPRALRVSQ